MFYNVFKYHVLEIDNFLSCRAELNRQECYRPLVAFCNSFKKLQAK